MFAAKVDCQQAALGTTFTAHQIILPLLQAAVTVSLKLSVYHSMYV